MNHVDFAIPNHPRHAPIDTPIAARLPAEHHDLHAFGSQFFADLPQGIEAVHGRFEVFAPLMDDLAREHLRSGE